MPLEDLLGQNTTFKADNDDRLRNLSRDQRLPTLAINDWRHSWTDLARRYVVGETEQEKFRNFPAWANEVRNLIYSLYENWVSDHHPADSIQESQNMRIDTWNNYINRKIEDARGTIGNEGSIEANRRQTSYQPQTYQQPGYAPEAAPEAAPYYGGGGGGDVNVYNTGVGGRGYGGRHGAPPPGRAPRPNQPAPRPQARPMSGGHGGGHGRRH
jgi:hypothetical protein